MLNEHDQDTFIESEKTNGLGEHEMAILENLAKLSTNGFEKVMKEHKLDAMVTPGSRASAVYAIGGYPGWLRERRDAVWDMLRRIERQRSKADRDFVWV